MIYLAEIINEREWWIGAKISECLLDDNYSTVVAIYQNSSGMMTFHDILEEQSSGREFMIYARLFGSSGHDLGYESTSRLKMLKLYGRHNFLFVVPNESSTPRNLADCNELRSAANDTGFLVIRNLSMYGACVFAIFRRVDEADVISRGRAMIRRYFSCDSFQFKVVDQAFLPFH